MLHSISGLGRLDQFPEFWTLLQGLILLHLQAGAEHEVLECMPIEDAVNDQPQLMPLEINAVIAHSEPVQDPAGPLELAEVFQLRLHHLLGQSPELAKDLQLQFLGHSRQLSGAGGVEYDLKRAHFPLVQSCAFRTRLLIAGRPRRNQVKTTRDPSLSDSTEAYDRGKKFEQYRQIPSCCEFLLVSQKEPRIEQFVHQPNGEWTLKEAAGPDAQIELPSLDIVLPLRKVFAKVQFSPGRLRTIG